LLSLVVGNLLSLYLHKNEYHYSAVGASGAVMGVIYSAILLGPLTSTIYFMPAWLFGLLYLFYSIYGMRKRVGNIGHDAHFGGAIAGYLITIAFKPGLIDERLWLIGLLAIPILVLFVLYKLGKI
jgi:membrane associated rhomboid family serine protease